MPSGRTHDVLGVVTAVPLAGAAFSCAQLLTGNVRESTALGLTCAVCHVVGTLFFSPDLDLDSSIYRRWGPLRIIWLPYQKLIRHRSKLSHSALAGPMRLLYFIIALLFIYITLLGFTSGLSDFFGSGEAKERALSILKYSVGITKAQPLICAFVLAGFTTSSGLHVLADDVWSTLRRWF